MIIQGLMETLISYEQRLICCMEKSVKSALQSELTISSKNDESTNTS